MAAEKELLQGIALMKEGKEEGFNILYSYTYNFVYARARAATKNETDAQDLTQETFLQAYRGIASLEDDHNVYAWLGGIVFRQGAKLHHKTERESLVDEDQEFIFDNIETKDVDSLPEESAQLKATSDVVMSMIEELPELQRSAIVSFYYDHMKLEEIASIFDCSVNTIKSRLNYAKKFLKERVEEHQLRYNYKLFSFSPAVLLLALRELMDSEKYTMAPESAEKLYRVACDSLGITASALATGAAVGSAATAATTASATVSASAASTAATAAKTVGAIGKFAAYSVAKKVGIIALSVSLLAGTVTTAVLLSNQKETPVVELADSTPTPLPTETPMPEPTETPSPTPEPTPTPEVVRHSADTMREYYELLGELAKTGVDEVTVALHSFALTEGHILNDVPELQRYAGINVSLTATETGTYQVNPLYSLIQIKFTYGETEIAAYSSEDYWDKIKKATEKQLEKFTVYYYPKSSYEWTLTRITYVGTFYLPDDFPSNAVIKRNVCDTTRTHKGAFVSDTYEVMYIDNNDVRISHNDYAKTAITEWYEGDRNPEVTFYIRSQLYTDANGQEYTNDTAYYKNWFSSTYPDSEYQLEEILTDGKPISDFYVAFVIKKTGESLPPSAPIAPAKESVSLAPVATPNPSPSLKYDTTLDVTTLSKNIVKNIIHPGMSDLEKVKAIHDYLVMHVDLDIKNTVSDTPVPESTTAVGALSIGYATASGYADAFNLLCKETGLESSSVSGTYKPLQGKSLIWQHVWNQVQVDGQWYHIDVAADDPFSSLKEFSDHSKCSYQYFLINDQGINAFQHVISSSAHPCTEESVSYDASKYGCPWETIGWNPSLEEVVSLTEEACKKGYSGITLIYTEELGDDFDIYYAIDEGLCKQLYTIDKAHSREQSLLWIPKRIYYAYYFPFVTVDGTLTPCSVLDSEKHISTVLNNILKNKRRKTFAYAPDKALVENVIRSYPLPENVTLQYLFYDIADTTFVEIFYDQTDGVTFP